MEIDMKKLEKIINNSDKTNNELIQFITDFIIKNRQEDIAEKTGLSQAQISRLKTGKRYFTVEKALSIAKKIKNSEME